MQRWKLILAFLLIPALLSAQGLPLKDGNSSTLAEVNENGALEVVHGKDATDSYIFATSNQVVTAAATTVMSLEAEVARGFRVTKVCIEPGTATAAAVVQWQIVRTTTASSDGTAVSAETSTGNNALAKADPADANWSGVGRILGTAGTSGAILDTGMAHVAITATPPTTFPYFCREYGIVDGKQPTVLAGTTNGIKLVFEGTAGGADFGAQIHFVAN